MTESESPLAGVNDPSTKKLLEKFCGLVNKLSENLNRSFDDVKRDLQKLFEQSGISILICKGTNLDLTKDVSSLCTQLRKMKVCLESDVDILLELFTIMNENKLKQAAITYAEDIAELEVVKYLPQQNDPLEMCSLLTTIHKHPALKFQTAFDIKRCLSDLLCIKQHAFALVGSKSILISDPVSLIWQVPTVLMERAKSKFTESDGIPKSMLTLLSSKHHLTCVTLKMCPNSESIVMFSTLSHQFTAAGTSSVHASASSLSAHQKYVDKYRDNYAELSPDIAQSVAATEGVPNLKDKFGLEDLSTYTQDSEGKFTDAVQDEAAPAVVDSESILSYKRNSDFTVCSLRPVCQREEILPCVIALPSHAPIMQSHAISEYSEAAATAFHCPCGGCSLESYLRNSCPQSCFPYLELSKLDCSNRENLIQRLSQETTNMIDSFSDLIDSTCSSLKSRNVSTIELARRVLELEAYIPPNALKPLMMGEAKELKKSKTIDESFLVLQPHMSFFNFYLLEHIIKGRRTGSDEDRQQLQQYCKKFELYCKRRIVEVPKGVIGQITTDLSSKRKLFVVVASNEKPLAELTLGDARKITRNIATLLGLESSTLYLHKVDEGSLILVFSVPRFVALELFPLGPSKTAVLARDGYSLFVVPDSASNSDVKHDAKTANAIRDMFKELVSETCDYLAASFTKLLRLLLSLEDLFSSVERARLKLSKTSDDVFEILGNYWDFINYDLLKFILDNCGNEALQRKMEKYIDVLLKLPITIILVTKENPPSNFSVVRITLSADRSTTYSLQNFERYRLTLQEALGLRFERMKLRTEMINVDTRVATLSLPRQYVPPLLDLHQHIQEVTIETVDGLRVEEYVKYFEDKPRFILKAAKQGLTEVTKTMLVVDQQLVNECDKEGNTALILAAMLGCVTTVKVLIEAGANVNEKNLNGETALMLAVSRKHTDTVKYLLFEAKADPNIAKYDDGFTALKLAAQFGLSDVLNDLIEAGADVNMDSNRWTALMSAAWRGTPEAVAVLVNNGAKVDMKDSGGMTALMWAAKKDEQDQVLNQLIYAGADVTLQNIEGKTALMLAAECGCVKNVANILATRHIQKKTGPDGNAKLSEMNLDLRDKKGETTLMKAKIGGHTEIVTMLIAAGADPRQLEEVKNIKSKFLLEDDVQFGYHEEVHGANIELSGNNFTIAKRKDEHSTEKGFVFSAMPVTGTAEFEFKIISVESDERSLSFGVMRVARGLQLVKYQFVRKLRGYSNSCIWNSGKVYNMLEGSQAERTSSNYGYVDLASVKEGDRVGLQLSSFDGSLSFYVNEKHQGFAAKGVYDDKSDVYVIVEHTGGCIGTKITQAVIHEPNLQDLCVKVITQSLSHKGQVENLPLSIKLKKKITALASISQL